MLARSIFTALIASASVSLAQTTFPQPNDTQALTIPLESAQNALAKMQLPPGFKATVFAAEPDLCNPIATCWDERGRLWVAENYTYGDSNERYNLKLRDRILIFEDTDNDGRFDKRTVFTDQIQMLTSIERGYGGIWAVAPPHLLFIPDKDGDDVPDGPPVVKLDGFSTQAASRHTFANGLKWGPDGWLYGRCGISSTSYVGTPGTDDKDRLAIAGGLWRFHPEKGVYDVVCYGTTNPWGHDWDKHGDLFFINTVIGHLWHGIHGAHLKRMHGQDLNPRAYQLMDQIADHYHWDTGKKWTDSREGAGGADSMGGGHAHVGMTIYQGINWPEAYRGKLLTLNLGGRRVNVERLEPQGSSYVGKHEPDMLKTDDPWFRGIEITYGPDGGVYILDWSDIGECHENDGVHRNSGRIYKITYGDAKKPHESDLTKLSNQELVTLQLSNNEWLVRMARWELRERRHRQPDQDYSAIAEQLAALKNASITESQRLNVLWTEVALSGLGSLTNAEEKQPNTALMRQAIHLLGDQILLAKRTGDKDGTRLMPHLKKDLSEWAADQGNSPALRRSLASFAIKNPAWAPLVIAPLLSHAEDAKDPYLPLLYWYAMMDQSPQDLVRLFADCQIPLVRQFIARRCVEEIEKDPQSLNQLLVIAQVSGSKEVLQGMTDGLKGWAKAKKPDAWDTFAKATPADDGPVSEQLRALNLLFGDGRALDDIKKLALDENADIPARASALQSLITAKADGLQQICEQLVRKQGLSMVALRGLTLFDDPSIGEKLAKSYSAFYPQEKSAVLDVLSSRKTFAKSLLNNIDPKRIPKEHLTPMLVRQIRTFHDAELDKKLEEVWGSLRETSADKQALITQLKAKFTTDYLKAADKSQGRAVYNLVCAACHKLYGEGHLIGPDLTGSGRKDVNYLIENIVDPSALLANDYKMTVVTMKDGRILSGNVSAKTDRTLTLKMVGQEQTVEVSEIAKSEQLPMSLMPEGLLLALNEDQVRNLIAYLMTDDQVPLPETK